MLAVSGPTPERLGLLGGRYKRLFADAKAEDKTELLDSAIDAYQRGMELDLNQYYCSCNLPRLYRQRKLNDDGVRADIVAKVVLAACERAEKLGLADEWLKQTLLGAAFDARECEKAEKLAAEVRSKPGERWKLTSTIRDLELSTNQVEDKNTKDRLTSHSGVAEGSGRLRQASVENPAPPRNPALPDLAVCPTHRSTARQKAGEPREG